jgi:hypothetical protein
MGRVFNSTSGPVTKLEDTGYKLVKTRRGRNLFTTGRPTTLRARINQSKTGRRTNQNRMKMVKNR